MLKWPNVTLYCYYDLFNYYRIHPSITSVTSMREYNKNCLWLTTFLHNCKLPFYAITVDSSPEQIEPYKIA